ncbi:hypothetical protein PHYSODRAFT_516413 [Phytophthora sojae]|uniref:GH16 domain-containing protein n=1 Tax=Phytophthora sojae (strain P6497) TaxID=1094619 RepID=G4ZVP2_PHYSP|nr:hypothetical protein PHYSODRAFT_516413 [Phytophthora sojae]EGZ11507.1 hypothetical protein PHYSODRAFT_516413 [Phytophthora sojae]|eukprot:XP_009531840.1 hypothetical protein PHYSODRAFT_516413 [Phytophthora sojae]
MRALLLFAAAFGVLIYTSQAQSTALDSLELFATPLPAHFGVLESVQGLELRLYLTGTDSKAVRVTPTCSGVSFNPSSVVFTSSISVASGIIATAQTTGNLEIDYVATLIEGDGSSSAVLFSQSVSVLPVPTAYDVDDEPWGGVILQSDSFDDTTATPVASSFWSNHQHGYSSSACGGFNGTNSLFFTSLGERLALTAPLELEGFHGKMHFYHVYGFEQVQEYDSTGDNRIACEMTDADEEVRFGYLPQGADLNNISTWNEILEIPLPSNATARTSDFTAYSVILPQLSMHQNAQFFWMQKNHSSFPIDVATGLTRDEVIAAENDPTGAHGELGVKERELWKYRNLFDQWAIDDVSLEVRLNVPIFSLVPSATFNSTTGVGIGGTNVLVASPVPGSWVAVTSGDGTQAFPDCTSPVVGDTANKATVALSKSGYVHAVACLSVSDLVISSYPVRSPRFLVQAVQPSISSSVDITKSVDTWEIDLQCTDCEFIRYITVPLDGVDGGSLLIPSCTFGSAINATTGKVSVTFNAKIRAVACGTDLLQSNLVESEDLIVHPRKPTFTYVVPSTTISGFMNLTIVPPPSANDQKLGIAYSVLSEGKKLPTCSNALTSGGIELVVKVFDVVRAVACCVGVVCADSVVATWGPVDVQAVTPTYSTACSTIKPLTLVVNLAAVTIGATVRYQILSAGDKKALTCTSGDLYQSPLEVGAGAVLVSAVSCLDGLKDSDSADITVTLDKCCAGRSAYQYDSCAHVLLMQDDFTKCPGNGGAGNMQTNTNWNAVTSQWGGSNVNGGVSSDNVRCVGDAALGKSVLELTANGDLYAGVAPIGKTMGSDGTLTDRTTSDRFMEWALDGISPLPCNPLEWCPARRVGAAVTSVLEQNAGVMVLRIKPCAAFGTLTQVWWGSYEAATSSALPFLPLWKSALYQAKTTPNIAFTLTPPEPTDDAAYTEIVMQWDASAARANLYKDGQLVLKQVGMDGKTDSTNSLSIGVWFPNAAAGEPFFPSCHTYVDDVQVFDLQITGGRWCDFEDVGADTISCVSNDDCEEWVQLNCFMDIYEAVCTYSRATDIDDGNTSASSNSTTKFCQFRLQPTAQTSVSNTAMTTRELEMEWVEVGEPKQEAE